MLPRLRFSAMFSQHSYISKSFTVYSLYWEQVFLILVLMASLAIIFYISIAPSYMIHIPPLFIIVQPGVPRLPGKEVYTSQKWGGPKYGRSMVADRGSRV